MSKEKNTIFSAEVRLKNGEVLRLCCTTFEQLGYHLRDLNKSLIQEVIIVPTGVGNVKIVDMRQGRFNN